MTQFSRRNLLRMSAAGAAGLGMWQTLTQRALAQSTGAKRVIFWYHPEGAAQQAFWPGTGPGALDINMAASVNGRNVDSKGQSINSYRNKEMGTFCLQPLKDYQSDITLLSGFRNDGGGSDDAHAKHVNTALTGNGNGRSIDQILGDHLQGDSPFSAIFSGLFARHAHPNAKYLCPLRLASGGPGSPTWNPVTTYNQVFPTGIPGPDDVVGPKAPNHELESKLALMGTIKGRLQDAHCRGGAVAKARMEAYLESVERIEAQTKAILDAEDPKPPASIDLRVNLPNGWDNTNNPNKYWQKSDNFKALVKIQIDTTVAALALNRTKVSLMQFSGTGTDLGIKDGLYDGLHYRKAVDGLEGSGQLHDHEMGHADSDQERRNQARIFRWYYAQLAYMIERLKSIPEDGGSLFDNTLIVCCSEWGMYNHRNNDMPYMLIGNPGGAFKNKGRYIDVHNGSFRNHTDLFLAVCKGMGMGINSFGGSSNTFNDILA